MTLERQGDEPAAAVAYAKLADSEENPPLSASAAQAQIRCLVQSGAKEAALAAMQHRFGGSRPAPAMDAHGRLIAADEQLLALHLAKRGDSRYAATAQRLAGWLNDYRVSMPSAQRLFLMDELRTLAPDAAAFPTGSAERLAAQFVESEPPRPGDAALEICRLPNLWRLASPDRRAIALYSGDSVAAAMDGCSGSRTVRRAPGSRFRRQARSLQAMPFPRDPCCRGGRFRSRCKIIKRSIDAARRRRAAYLWAGYLAVAAIALAGLLAGQSLRGRRGWRG